MRCGGYVWHRDAGDVFVVIVALTLLLQGKRNRARLGWVGVVVLAYYAANTAGAAFYAGGESLQTFAAAFLRTLRFGPC